MTCEVHHRMSGPPDAPVVVLSNSLGTDMSMWDRQLPALEGRFRVLRYDTRGHGSSPAPPGPYAIADLGGDVTALLDRLDLERVHFCGVSIGGMTGMWLAAHAPERVERLALCFTSAYLDPEGAFRERAAVARTSGLEELAEAALGRWFTAPFRAANPELMDDVRRHFLGSTPEGYAGCCEAISAMDLRGVLDRVRTPTLVISGEHDPATPPDHGRAIADAIAGARYELVDSAHLGNVERPHEVNELILGHLTKETT